MSCQCSAKESSTTQTLDELEFERGIWTAALEGDSAKVRSLVNKDPDCVNKRDGSGYTGLHYASRSGHPDTIRVLLENGADPNAATPTGKVTPLHRAAYMGHTDCVELLLERGADPGLTDSDGMTALHKAAERNKTECFRALRNSASEAIMCVKDLKGKTAKDYHLSK